MASPYSCIEACNLSLNGKNEWVIFGASGSSIAVQSSSGASTVWPADVGKETVSFFASFVLLNRFCLFMAMVHLLLLGF
jgi:hypothetical protein